MEEIVQWLESKGYGWSFEHTGYLYEARIWDWPNVIGRYRPDDFIGLEDMAIKALEDAGLYEDFINKYK